MTDLAIIIPAYNSLPYITEARQALEMQSNQSFVICCIDDASTDGTREFLDAWAMEDNRIHVEDGCGLGVSHARNVGLLWLNSLSEKPRYLLFHDSDDMFAPGAFQHLVSLGDELQTDVLLFTAKSFYQSDEMEQRFPQYHTLYDRHAAYLDGISGPELLRIAIEGDEFTPQVCMQLTRTEHVLEHHLHFEEGIIHEDNLYTMCNLLTAKRTALRNEQLYLRRLRPHSLITSGISWNNVIGYVRCGLRLMEYLDKHPELHLSESQIMALETQVERWYESALEFYGQLNKEERERAKELSPADSLLFASIVERRFLVQKQHQAAVAAAQKQLRTEFENSVSWRVGRAMTSIPRALRHIRLF